MLPFLQLVFALAVIIVAAKLGGYLSQRLRQPTVAGKVLMGLILGPPCSIFCSGPCSPIHRESD
jgi:Kef-type K+ transport system membrane component KefB